MLHSHDCLWKKALFSADGSCTVIQGNEYLDVGDLLGIDRWGDRCHGRAAAWPSVVAGILGGLVLGPLAALMQCVSGVTGSDQRRLCPSGLEWIKANATVCRHCRRDQPERRPHVRIEPRSKP